MKRIYIISLAILLSLPFARFSSAQDQEEGMLRAVSITPGIGFEFFSRTITWDNDLYTSKLKSSFFTFNTEFEFGKGFFLNAILGYATPGSNYHELAFRELPFSVELRNPHATIKGYLIGVEIRKGLIYANTLQIDVLGQFLYYTGTKKTWEIPELAVDGTVEGTPSWMRASIGPVFTYTGFDYFYPYLRLDFTKLWGKFKMVQTVQDLSGSESQEVTGASSFSTAFGTIFKLTDVFSIKAEGNFLPHGDAVDFGFTVRMLYSF